MPVNKNNNDIAYEYHAHVMNNNNNNDINNNSDSNSNKEFNNLIFSTTEPCDHISSIIEGGSNNDEEHVNSNNATTATAVSSVNKKCLSEGSISGSITNLCNATLGAGVLSLPYAISKSGIIIGIFLLLLAATCTDLSINILVEAMHLSKCKSYEEMTMLYYGYYFTILVECCIIIFCLGTNVAYIIAVGDMLEQTLLSYLDSNLLTRNTSMVLFWICIMFPVSLCQRINSLRYLSVLSTLVVYLLIISIAYHSIKFMILEQNVDGSTSIEGMYDHINYWPDSITDVLLACPIIMFSFANQINVCQVYNELSVRTPGTMKIVSKYSVLLCFIAYSLTSIFGYINFQNQIDEDILSNYCLNDNPDVFIYISTCAFVMLGITLSFPFNVLPCRITLDVILRRMCSNVNNKESFLSMDATTDEDSNDISESLLPNLVEAPHDNTNDEDNNDNDEQLLSPIRNFVLTLVISGVALFFAILIPNISILFGLMGGSSAACICFIMPSLFYLKMHDYNTAKNRSELCRYVGVWCLLVGGFVIGVLGTAVTIYSLIYDDHDNDTCDS